MKKLFCLLLFVSAGLFSQIDDRPITRDETIKTFSNQTTLEEYNYVSKGYKIQLESGLDMKNGYTLKDIENFVSAFNAGSDYIQRKSTFKLLYKNGQKLPVAIMMILERKDNNYIDYFCIPSYYSESDLWKVFYKDFTKNLKTETVGMSSLEIQNLTAKYSYYFNSLRMISYCLTTNNIKQ